MVVRLNDKIVLDGSYTNEYAVAPSVNTDANLGPCGPQGWTLAGGAWFDIRRGDLIKLEILIGDGGGLFSDYLFIDEKGVKLADRKDAPGFSAYPIFQTMPTSIPKKAGKDGNPQPADRPMIFPASGTTSALDVLRR
jgi:hypothetical protein